MKFKKQLKQKSKYAYQRSVLRFDRRMWEESLDLLHDSEFMGRFVKEWECLLDHLQENNVNVEVIN